MSRAATAHSLHSTKCRVATQPVAEAEAQPEPAQSNVEPDDAATLLESIQEQVQQSSAQTIAAQRCRLVHSNSCLEQRSMQAQFMRTVK